LISGAPEDFGHTDIDEAHLKDQADKLVKVLADFNVFGEVKEIHPGPVVTMFEFQPKSGTKLSKIEGLSNELAMVLEVIRVRVVAPIPGKHAVGFELPNRKRETVYLKDMLVDDSFNNPKYKLPLALGRDIAGDPIAVDLAKMPHLLIAGTTGSGKSVSVNAMLLSLLYKYTPEDLRLLLVDPKMIELGIYDHIPHLLLPVVTDMSKACLALKWAVDEMERRYQLFADLGVRNLAAYNKKVSNLKAEHAGRTEAERAALVADDAVGVSENGDVVVVSSVAAHPEKLEKLPFIVTVVDELADLMMVAAKDVETSIARLAQKARASGIHLIIATQRPSVDVITGLIKANFPSRISFRVSSGTDSRTILGTVGAENLLGMGDMLILPPGTSDLTRVHGAFVEDEEIHKVVDFLKEQGKPQYDEEILKPRDDDDADIDETEKDEVYDQAVAIVAEAQSCSISMLQRRLRIGYNRSARIVEIMEKEGVVGPSNGVNKREVLISPQ
jgi:S-DNA-T family DNA segregation ATPase FtsK/SpoIIIE